MLGMRGMKGTIIEYLSGNWGCPIQNMKLPHVVHKIRHPAVMSSANSRRWGMILDAGLAYKSPDHHRRAGLAVLLMSATSEAAITQKLLQCSRAHAASPPVYVISSAVP